MNPFEEAYKNELLLIQANGDNLDALKFRFDELNRSRSDMLKLIEQKTIEIAGRKKALKECVHKLRKD